MKLDKEERNLIDSIEKGDWRSITDLQEEIERSKEIAKATVVKDQRMNIRIVKKGSQCAKSKSNGRGNTVSDAGVERYSQILIR